MKKIKMKVKANKKKGKREDNIDNEKDIKNEKIESENKNINEKKEVNNEEIIVDCFSGDKENNNDDLDINNETLKIDEEKKKEEPKRKNSNKKKKEKDDKDYTIRIENDNDDDEKNRRPLLSNNADGDEEGEKQINILAVLKLALKSQRLILFSAIVILQDPVSNMAFTLYREIREYKKIDVKYLQLVGPLYFIFECISSFVFGILCDYIQLKYLLFFINGVGTFIGFIYCLTFKDGLIFFLV